MQSARFIGNNVLCRQFSAAVHRQVREAVDGMAERKVSNSSRRWSAITTYRPPPLWNHVEQARCCTALTVRGVEMREVSELAARK